MGKYGDKMVKNMDMKQASKNLSNKDLIKILSQSRNKFGGEPSFLKNELKRRKKLGLIKAEAGQAKTKSSGMSNWVAREVNFGW